MYVSKFTTLAMLLSFSLFVATGCETDTEPGGPGVKDKDPSEEKVTGERDVEDSSKTYELALPSGDISIEQGQTQKFEIGVERGDELTQDVEISLKATQEGVSVSPESYTFSGDKKEAEFSITATESAKVGETAITVIGKLPKAATDDAKNQVNGSIAVEVIKGDDDSDD